MNKRILEFRNLNGQFEYRIRDGIGNIIVPWMFGTFDQDETIADAKSRFIVTDIEWALVP